MVNSSITNSKIVGGNSDANVGVFDTEMKDVKISDLIITDSDENEQTKIAENYIAGKNHGIQSSKSDFIIPTTHYINSEKETKIPTKSLLEILA